MKTKQTIFSPRTLVQRITFSLMGMLCVVLIACSPNEASDELQTLNPDELTIIEFLESYGNEDSTLSKSSNSKSPKKDSFKTLSVALAKTGLAGTVSSEMLTVFAPTDKAFGKLGLDHRNIVSVLGIETLSSILLYHAVAGKVYSGDLTNSFVATLNGGYIGVNLDNGVIINDSMVIMADIKARNGVIHAIDHILMPPTKNITELAIDSFGIESALVKAVLRAQLQGTLADGGPFTVFAPEQNAFDEFLASQGLNSVDEIPMDLLTKVLLYHVVDGSVFSTDLANSYVPTLNGAAINIDLDSGVMINDSNVIAANIQATNGVVHVIDKLLFPPTLNLVETASSFAPEFSILLEAATKSGLANELATGGPYTIFAPTNAAFLALLDELDGVNSLDDLPVETLMTVLKYHVVSGRKYSSDLSSGPVDTLNGSFDLDLSTLTLTDNNTRDSSLDTSLLNVQATNGVIHVIDRVLLP